MKGKLLKSVLIVLAALVLVAILLLNVLDSVAAAALTKSVQKVGEVDCQVEEVNISILGGSVGVRDLKIANPKGYPEVSMFSLHRADVQVSVRSLMGQPVHIKKLEIIKPRIRVEAGVGGSNIKVFLDTVKKNVGAEAEEPAPGEKEPAEPIRLVVDRLLIEDATIEFGSGISSLALPVTLQTVELPPVTGENGQGVTPGELVSMIVEELVSKGVVQVRVDPNVKLDLEKIFSEDTASKVSEEVEKAFGEAAGKAAGEAIKKAGKILEDILKPKKEE